MELDFLSVVETLKALSLGGISLAVLVVILTEVVKEFTGLQGKAVRAVALGLGFALTAIAYGLTEGLIPASAAPYIEWVFAAVAGGLGGMGLWHLGKRFLSTNTTSDGDVADAVARQLQARGFLSAGEIAGESLPFELPEPGTYTVQDPNASISLADSGLTVTNRPRTDSLP